EIYSNFDTQFRALTVTYLDGTSTQTSYGCCGIDSFTDRDGTVTSYMYDDLKRQTNATVNGITTYTSYDAANRKSFVARIGSNGAVVMQARFGYDLAGRLVFETNALNQITKYDYTIDGGENVKTITYAWGSPFAATRIERYGKDGLLIKT